MILALGRGRTGKTLWSRWLVEAIRAKGVSPVVADADVFTHGASPNVRLTRCSSAENKMRTKLGGPP